MKTTRYFEEQVLRKRPYIQQAWCGEVLAAPIRREVQRRTAGSASGAGFRQRERLDRAFSGLLHWSDGETVHNAFFDRNFREDKP